MTEAETRPPPLPPRLDWFVHTQMGQLAGAGIPEWFHGTISREAAENLLESQPLGSFLVRVSHSHVGYTLSYKAADCCRHFMVKMLDDGRLVIPGEAAVHASLDALVTFHRQRPVRPHQELLTQPCGQKDPENVDYEDLFLYSYILAEEAAGPAQDPRECDGPSSGLVAAPKEAPARPVLLHRSAKMNREPPEEAASPGPPKVPFGEAREKLWRHLKTLPQSSRRVRQQLKSHLRGVSLSALWEARRSAVAQGSRSAADRQEHTGHAAQKDVPKDPRVATDFDNPARPPRGGEAPSRKATRASSWSEVAPGTWHQPVLRALSSQEAEPEPQDLAGAHEDWLPEEYRPPPPFAPGYC